MEYRCPQHDVVFQTETDHTKPGSIKAGAEKSSHPRNAAGEWGHPDCPLCQKEAKPVAKATGAGGRQVVA
jgi:hypothetical protein